MRSVTEVVVAGAHVEIGSRAELEKRANERSRGIVEERININTSSCGSKSDDELFFSHGRDGGFDVPHGSVRSGCGVVDVQFFNLHDIGSISATSTLASVTSLSITSRISVIMGVGASPLDMNPVVLSDGETVGMEIILDCWEGLDDVSSFSADDDVVDQVVSGSCRTRFNGEDMRTILEGTTSLGGVDGKTESLHDTDIDGGVLTKRRELVVEGGVDEPVDIGGGDVVTHAEDTLAGFSSLATSFLGGRNGPVVRGHVAIEGVTEMVIAGPNSHLTRDVVRAAKAAEGGLVPVTAGFGFRGQDGDILPGVIVPPWVVIAFLGAFIATTVAVGVLTSIDGGLTVQILISSPETLITLDIITTGSIVLTRFMETSGGVIGILGRSVGGRSITEIITTHVLKDVFTTHLTIGAASVLIRPFNGKDRSLKEGHAVLFGLGVGCVSTSITNIITTTIVILRIEHTIGVVTISRLFVQTVVGTTRNMEIMISGDRKNKTN